MVKTFKKGCCNAKTERLTTRAKIYFLVETVYKGVLVSKPYLSLLRTPNAIIISFKFYDNVALLKRR